MVYKLFTVDSLAMKRVDQGGTELRNKSKTHKKKKITFIYLFKAALTMFIAARLYSVKRECHKLMAVNRRFLSADAQFRSEDRMSGIFSAQSGTGREGFSEFIDLPCHLSFHQSPTVIPPTSHE